MSVAALFAQLRKLELRLLDRQLCAKLPSLEATLARAFVESGASGR